MGVSALTLSDVLQGRFPLGGNSLEINAISKARGHKFMAIVLAPTVKLGPELVPPLLEVLDTVPEGGAIDIFVDTLGGAAEETWRLVSILRERFDHYSCLIPFAASPGATQVALGADEVVMGPASSLAPLEPARIRAVDTDGERFSMSAYDLRSYLGFLRREVGEITGEALSELWKRIDPLLVGVTEKAHQSLLLTTRRALETHMDDTAQVDRVLQELGGGVASHKFPFTRRDAESRLGLHVIRPGRQLAASMWGLRDYYNHMLEIEGDVQLGDKHYRIEYDGFIDTAHTRRVLLRVTRVDERGRALPDLPTIRRWVEPSGGEMSLDQEVDL